MANYQSKPGICNRGPLLWLNNPPLFGIHSKDCHELKTKAHTGAFMCLPEVVCSLSHREDYPDTHPSLSLNTATCQLPIHCWLLLTGVYGCSCICSRCCWLHMIAPSPYIFCFWGPWQNIPEALPVSLFVMVFVFSNSGGSFSLCSL